MDRECPGTNDTYMSRVVLDSIWKQIVGASVHMPCDRDTLVLTWTLRPISSELFINPG